MQIDEVVWQVINHGFCSFKTQMDSGQDFCKNEYNLTGLCSRQSCPLANSNYATIKEIKGVCYLFIKTIERSHKPKDLWEKIKLDKNYQKALGQIDEQLQFWPKFIIHKSKQRLTKLRQMIIRMRKLKLQGYEEYTVIKQKTERRDKIREKKALVAANIEGEIENELLARLQQGTYGDIYNFEKEEEQDEKLEEDLDQQEFDYNEDLDESDYSEEESLEELQIKKKVKTNQKKNKINIEIEEERNLDLDF